MTDLSDAALRERAVRECPEGPPHKRCPRCDWQAQQYIALRDAARAEQRVLIAQVQDIANDCEQVARVEVVSPAERRTWLSIAKQLRATALRAGSKP